MMRTGWPLFVVLSGCAACFQSQEASDQAQLRRHFAIPADARVVEYKGFPETSGFGQREGLHLSARYHLTPGQMSAWAASARAKGWESLPPPPEVAQRMAFFGGEKLIGVRDGLYLCRTAGDDVLHAILTKPCAAVEKPNDILMGAADTGTGEIMVTVSSSY
ncbi:MAG TPA: hypothetical protein VM870_04720 [Pyrinomonadaceae bacterium]|nr:hypothetical protein [Pyrinomonadaceae bacterium]